MIFLGLVRGEINILDRAVSAVINQEIFVPADDIAVVFPYSDGFPKLEKIYAVDDGAGDAVKAVEERNILFEGIVDEQVFKADQNGASVTVYARSPAALLIDNECEPTEYVNPSEEVVYLRHLMPFGIEFVRSGKKCRNDRLRIPKGSSHYKALEKFCGEFLNTAPRIDSRGVCRTDVYELDEEIYFDNESGVSFDFVSVTDNRYSRVSKVYVSSSGSGYDSVVSDSEAVEGGIVRERYLCLLDSKTGTLSDAYDILENGAKNSFSVSLGSSERLINKIGAAARIDVEGCEGIEFVVAKIKYTSDINGEYSKVKLVLKQ